MAVIHVIQKEIYGSLDQLTIKWEDGVGGTTSRLKPFLKPAGMLQGLDIPNPTALTAQWEAPSLACPELAYLGLFDLIVEASERAQCLAGRELLEAEGWGGGAGFSGEA